MNNQTVMASAVLFLSFVSGCASPDSGEPMVPVEDASAMAEAPEYFLLRPEVEKAYGYTHAVKIGDHIKISGAVSMDDEGNPTAVGDLEQQMKNAYSDLDEVLRHYGYSFDDVIVEDVFTTEHLNRTYGGRLAILESAATSLLRRQKGSRT